MKPIQRIHHISATVGDPNENLAFYRDILGLRLVKQTVNFEDDGTYHLYFANQNADAGSIITFFPRLDNLTGRVGAGQVRRMAFSVPEGSINGWKNTFGAQGIHFEEATIFGKKALLFNDPHDLSLAIVETDEVQSSKEITGFYGIELLSEAPDNTFKVLMQEMGLQLVQVSADYYHLEMVGSEKHQILVNRTMTQRGRLGIGTVHHIAWSIPDEEELTQWKQHFEEEYSVTQIHDRKYFHSAYFRDPGHIIYELATDGPGFTVDESLDELGTSLMLPPQYEDKRAEIVARLPKLNV